MKGSWLDHHRRQTHVSVNVEASLLQLLVYVVKLGIAAVLTDIVKTLE